MRRLVHIFLFVTLLGFALSGCRQSAAERRLVEIDTLIARGTYDSALAQLRAIDTTTLSRDELAYHGLLMTHAAYKAYDSAYLDTTWIARARQAYAEGGPYDRHIRTLLYSGCVAEDLVDPLQAMHWCKLTELEAKKDDHLTLGHVNRMLGYIYQYNYVETDSAISKYYTALRNFDLCCTISLYQLDCKYNLGQLYRLVNADSALHYISESLTMSHQLGDSLVYYGALETLAGFYDDQSDYLKSKLYSQEIINAGMADTYHSCYYYASIAFCRLGQPDSAQIYFNMAPPPATLRDSVLYQQSLALLEQVKKHPGQSSAAFVQASEISEKRVVESIKMALSSSEAQKSKLHDRQRNKKKSKLHHALIVVGATLLLLVSLLALRYRTQIAKLLNSLKRERRLNQQMTEAVNIMEHQLHELEEKLNQSQGEDPSTLKNIELYHNCVNAIFKGVVHVGKHKKSLFSLPEMEEHQIELTEQLWQNARQFLYGTYPVAMEHIDKMNPGLSAKERQFLALECLAIPNVVIAKLLNYSDRSAITTRNRIVGKLGTSSSKLVVIIKHLNNTKDN